VRLNWQSYILVQLYPWTEPIIWNRYHQNAQEAFDAVAEVLQSNRWLILAEVRQCFGDEWFVIWGVQEKS
jgi:hypothetical protein